MESLSHENQRLRNELQMLEEQQVGLPKTSSFQSQA